MLQPSLRNSAIDCIIYLYSEQDVYAADPNLNTKKIVPAKEKKNYFGKHTIRYHFN